MLEDVSRGMLLEDRIQRPVKVTRKGDSETVSEEVLRTVLSDAQHMALVSDHTTTHHHHTLLCTGGADRGHVTRMESDEVGIGSVYVLEKDAPHHTMESDEVGIGSVSFTRSSPSAASHPIDAEAVPGAEVQGTLRSSLPPDQAQPKAKRTSILGFLGRLAAPILGKAAASLQGRDGKPT